MQTYYGTKRLKATPMTRLEYNNLRGWQLPADECGEDAGYLVEYADGGKPNVPGCIGYVSWSPKDVFEASYQPIDRLFFGHALEVLKAGGHVTRAAWNGREVYLFLVAAWPDNVSVEQYAPNLPFIAMRAADGRIVPWEVEQTDVLAGDWVALI